MAELRFVMVGGFLGAGKTTTLARLARQYQAQGRRVGIVTNDQAADLVDTHALRAQGFPVGEVAGACFCCRFNELVSTVEKLRDDERPDVVLAEPVGSCTDLAATIIQPLRQLLRGRLSIAPYGVLLKPSHGLRVLRGQGGSGFSPKAAYILEKQLEEADVILLNRIDELASGDADELTELVNARWPATPLLRVSARTGAGFDELQQFLAQEGNFGRRLLDIDYDVYAEGEAELGWLNLSLTLRSEKPIALDDWLMSVIRRLGSELHQSGAETAHLKVIGLWEGFFGVANLVSSWTAPELSLPSNCQVQEAEAIINARVACDPQMLEEHARRAAEAAARELGGDVEFRQSQSFRPGRPQPTHRYAAAVDQPPVTHPSMGVSELAPPAEPQDLSQAHSRSHRWSPGAPH